MNVVIYLHEALIRIRIKFLHIHVHQLCWAAHRVTRAKWRILGHKQALKKTEYLIIISKLFTLHTFNAVVVAHEIHNLNQFLLENWWHLNPAKASFCLNLSLLLSVTEKGISPWNYRMYIFEQKGDEKEEKIITGMVRYQFTALN